MYYLTWQGLKKHNMCGVAGAGVLLINYFVCVCVCVCVLREGALFVVKLQGALAINPGHQIRPFCAVVPITSEFISLN